MIETKNRSGSEIRLQGVEAVATREHMLHKMLESEVCGWEYWRTDLDIDSPRDLLRLRMIERAGEIRERSEGRWIVIRKYRLTDKGRRRAQEIDAQCVEVVR